MEATFRGMTRRSFLASAAAAGAVAASVGVMPSLSTRAYADPASADEQVFSGVCRGGCAGHCPLDVHVRDGKVVRTTASELSDARYNRVCSKGVSQVGRMYSEQRVKYPMRRKEGAERGEGSFERITWDEALDEIAEKWTQYAKESGPESIAYAMSSGNAGDASMYSAIMMGGVLGMSSVNGAVDQAQGFATSHITGSGLFGMQNAMEDFKNSKTFVCWGANPTTSAPHTTHFIWDAKEAGARYIVIDINANANTAKADWFCLSILRRMARLPSARLIMCLSRGGKTKNSFARTPKRLSS